MADDYGSLVVYGLMPAKQAYPLAKAAAQRALELDDTLAEAHTSLANVFFRYLELGKSAGEFERSIQLNPNYPTTHQWYGRLTLLALGQFDHAIAEAKRAVELDPVSPIGRTDVATVYLTERRYDEAVAELRNTLEIDPDFYWAHRQLGLALELKGAPAEAQQLILHYGPIGASLRIGTPQRLTQQRLVGQRRVSASLAGRLIIISIAWSCARQRSSPRPVCSTRRFAASARVVGRRRRSCCPSFSPISSSIQTASG